MVPPPAEPTVGSRSAMAGAAAASGAHSSATATTATTAAASKMYVFERLHRVSFTRLRASAKSAGAEAAAAAGADAGRAAATILPQIHGTAAAMARLAAGTADPLVRRALDLPPAGQGEFFLYRQGGRNLLRRTLWQRQQSSSGVSDGALPRTRPTKEVSPRGGVMARVPYSGTTWEGGCAAESAGLEGGCAVWGRNGDTRGVPRGLSTLPRSQDFFFQCCRRAQVPFFPPTRRVIAQYLSDGNLPLYDRGLLWPGGITNEAWLGITNEATQPPLARPRAHATPNTARSQQSSSCDVLQDHGVHFASPPKPPSKVSPTASATALGDSGDQYMLEPRKCLFLPPPFHISSLTQVVQACHL
eukprot:351108-Chlamydomonas_euryale.AAC.1